MTAPPAGRDRVVALLGVLVALTVVGSSAVAVALPVVERELGLDTSGSAWIFAGFALTFAVSTALFGRVADLAGMRGPLVAGVGLMALGALVAAVAPSFTVMVVGRLLQGLGAGAVPVVSNGILAARYEGPARTHALGRMIAIVSIVSGSGPLVGGTVTQLMGWRWCVALPALGLLVVPWIASAAPRGGSAAAVDVRGAVLTTAAVAGLVLLLQSPTAGLTVTVVGVAVAALAGPLLARHVPRHPDGFLPTAVVGDRRVLLAGVTGATLLAAYIAVLFAVPKLLVARLDLTPIQIGLVLLPAAVFGSLMARTAARYTARVGHFRLAQLAAAAGAAGIVLAATSGGRPVPAALGMAGASAAFAVGQLVMVDAVTGFVAEHVRGVALGIYNLMFFAGSAAGSAAIGGLSGLLSLPVSLACLVVLPAAGFVTAEVGRRKVLPVRTGAGDA